MNTIPLRDEIWFRKIYFDAVLAKKVRVIFRPGKRLCGDDKGFCKGEILKIKFLDKIGADWAGLPGQTIPDFEQKVRVIETCVIKLSSLTEKDFEGSTPDIFDKVSLVYHLGLVYNLFLSDLSDDAMITKTVFEYI